MRTLGSRVKSARESKGFTQTELAKKIRDVNPSLKTGQSTIQAIESGLSKRVTILYELAKALGVTEQWLSIGDGVKEKQINVTADQIYSAVYSSYKMLGLPDDEALELVQLVREAVEEPVAVPGISADAARQVLAESAIRKFLKSKNIP
jgi:transcriptional regulator with XRE-family HTH domain